MDPSSSNKTMEKPNPDPHPHQQPLKCPRCDSSNTKFCYYNNYSLSQPRHFCKACKRYWTRGGTLRSVPVGGGCRKNKRVKRPPPPQLASSAATNHVHAPHDVDLSPASNHMSTSLFYNNNFHHPTNNPLELNFPFSRFASSRVSSGYDFYQPNLNDFGLGFSNSGVLSTEDPVNLFGSGSSSGCSSTMASLLASIQQQQKFGLKETPANGTGFSGLMPYEHLDLQGRGGNGREEKMEGDDRLDEYHQNNQIHHDHHQQQQQQINSSSDANNSSLIWNTSHITSWFDPSTNTMGSSVPSLI